MRKIAQLAQMVREGAGVAEAARRMGVSQGTAASYAAAARRRGLLARDEGLQRSSRAAEAAALALAGRPMAGIAAAMDLDRSAVSDWLSRARKLGLLPADFTMPRGPCPTARQPRVRAVAALAAQGLTRAQIAARLGAHPRSVTKWLCDARRDGLLAAPAPEPAPAARHARTPKTKPGPAPARVRVSAVPVARLAAAAAPPAPSRGLRPDEAALVAEALAAGRVTVCPPRTYALSEAPDLPDWLVKAVATLPRPVPIEALDALIRRAYAMRTPDPQVAAAAGWDVQTVQHRRSRVLGLLHTPGRMSPKLRGRQAGAGS